MQVHDKVVIVTGAARGIGQAYALALARRGEKKPDRLDLECKQFVLSGSSAITRSLNWTYAAHHQHHSAGRS